ncbi:MAG TPA: HAD hydrolase family protein [Ignavibacteria bacterium]|jgi:3-deoxy-D-manno-octulosonate 8-phosphate phosphatase (KDO 8-P phosphatase)
MKNIDGIDFKNISFILMDMDGVLSDGSLFYLPDGHVVKIFHAHDGYGITRGREHGLKFGIISGKSALVNKYRAQKLKIEELYEDAEDKVAAYEVIRKKYNLKPENFSFIGDDVYDLPLLQTVAFACAPANAFPEVKDVVHYIAKADGGKGCVREVIDFILRRQGKIK